MEYFPSSISCPHCSKCSPYRLYSMKYTGESGYDVVGSTTVVSSSSGYSFKKGVAGALVFGPVGAVAGIGGKRKTNTEVIPNRQHYRIYKCEVCGYEQKVYAT